MKVKSSSNYQSQQQSSQSASKHIHQPVLHSSAHHHGGGPSGDPHRGSSTVANSQYLMSSSYKDQHNSHHTGQQQLQSSKHQNKGQSTQSGNKQTGQSKTINAQSLQQPLGQNGNSIQAPSSLATNGAMTLAELQQTPSQTNKGQTTKIVNLSFAGQEFQHRNMSTSMHNGFYVNPAAMEEAQRKQQQQQNSGKMGQTYQQQPGAANVNQSNGPSSQLSHSQQQQQQFNQYHGGQTNASSTIGNTNSVRSLGINQRQQVMGMSSQVGAGHSQNAAAAAQNQHQTNQGNFGQQQQNPGVFTNLHLQNTPAQKKNVSSKNAQRRKISQTNQSAQFQTSGNQLIQSAINNYPHTMKKKSSKAKMLVGVDASANSQGIAVSSFQAGAHHNSMSMTRSQNNSNKHQAANFKGQRVFSGEEESDNMFVHDNRSYPTYQANGQSNHHTPLPPDNIFGQSHDPTAAQQQSTFMNSMQGYMATKQLAQNASTPNGQGFKSMGLNNNGNSHPSSNANQADQPPQLYQYVDSQGQPISGTKYSSGGQGSLVTGSSNVRAKTMAPSVGYQMILQQPGSHGQQQPQVGAQQNYHLLQTQPNAKQNKNYMKVAPQFEGMHQQSSTYAKSQQRSYQSLQAQHLSMLNQAQVIQPSAQSPTPGQGNYPTSANPTVVVQQQSIGGQASFIHGRKLVPMKASGSIAEPASAGMPQQNSLQHDPSSAAQSTVFSTKAQSHQGSSSHQMYTRVMVPANGAQQPSGNTGAGVNNPLSLQELGQPIVQRTTSVPPQFEFQQQQQLLESGQLDQLAMQKMQSLQHSVGPPSQKQQQLVLNQAQIQYATRDGCSATNGQMQQAFQQTQPQPAFQPQSASKHTHLIVNIDNSKEANHQITKKRRLKTGTGSNAAYRSGAPGDPSDTDQMSEAGQSASVQPHKGQPQLNIVDVESNTQQLPVFINKQISETAASINIKDSMANSQQNFNSQALQGSNTGRNAQNTIAENNSQDGATVVDGTGKRTSRNDTQMPITHQGKPNSAVLNKRVPSLQGAGAQPSSRPDSKQGQNGVVKTLGISQKQKFDQELAARDALIGIDDEDENIAHHQDFSENEGESQMSAGDHSNDEGLQLQYTKSIDSDKIGKSGSLSFRQSQAGIKGNNPSATLQVPVGGSQLIQPQQVQHQAAMQPPLGDNSDIESDLSGSVHQHQMFVYAANNQRDPNASFNVLASDSETDGNFSDTGSMYGRGTTMRDDQIDGVLQNDIDGISEHSSDEADSDSDEVMHDGKKKEKPPGEKQVKKKKKKNPDEKAVTMKKQKGEKETAATTKKTKEKAHQAPAKKNFTEAKEKEYNAKGKGQKGEAPSKQKVTNAKDGDKKTQKPEKNETKTTKKDADPPVKTKKPKQPEESKGAAAAAADDKNKESPVKKKQKQKLNLALAHCQPKNIEEQKDAFFESDCKVNPVFEYENYAATQKFLAQFKEPSDELLDLSCRILNSFIINYGSESAYLETEGEIVSKDETLQVFTDYLEALSFEELLTVNFKANQVAPTSVTHDPKTGKSRVNIRDPPEYRRGRLMGVIDHEIGTHFMRKFNERFQVWHKKRDKWEMKSCIQTEEGFACVNQLVRTAWDGKQPFLYRSALNYYAAFMASKLSFVELFNDLEKYIDSRLSRWRFVLRLKRGMIETSEPGGLYKDQCYLEGAVQFLQNRQNIDIIGLFTGKISLDDLQKPKIQKVLNKESIKLPTFVQDMDRYMSALEIIAKTNHIPIKPSD